jgi:hypothetical protein
MWESAIPAATRLGQPADKVVVIGTSPQLGTCQPEASAVERRDESATEIKMQWTAPALKKIDIEIITAFLLIDPESRTEDS